MLYIVRCILELKTPLHCGQETDGILDAPVTRDPFGFWRIPGSSIAGVLRNYVHNHDPEHEVDLFGLESEHDKSASHVWCSDAVLLDYDALPAWKKVYQGQEVQIQANSYLRDHVCLDLDLGSAIQGGKFDEEYVPAGTRFAFELSLDSWMDELNDDVVKAFAGLLTGLASEELQFGAFASYDYGTYSIVAFQARKFDLTNPKSLEQWLTLQDSPLFPNGVGEPWQCQVVPKKAAKDTISGIVSIPLRTLGPILISGGSPKDSIDADMCFARTAYFDYKQKKVRELLVLPGSSLRGVLRHRIYQILIAKGCSDPLQELSCIFGKAIGNDKERGKVGVADAPLFSNNTASVLDDCHTIQHVSIDRFTGGAMDAHLFNEAPLWQEDVSFQLRIRLRELQPKYVEVLLHALLDLAEGKLFIGNGVNRGNGRVQLDKRKPIGCNLTWNGEKLTAKDHAKAKQWLAKIAKA